MSPGIKNESLVDIYRGDGVPELPEVETIKCGLEAEILGLGIVSVQVLRPASVGFPSPGKFSAGLRGKSFASISRRGKYLLIKLSPEGLLVVHLRMSGRLLAMAKGQRKSNHVRIRFQLTAGKELVFEDMRVFGRIWYIGPGKKVEEVVSGLGDLGPEPLSDEFDSTYLLRCLNKRSGPIKAALLDQSLLAGVGNIYADESLFLSGIHPGRSARSLKERELENLIFNIRAVLRKAIERGGSTLRDYVGATGVNGNYQHQALVYGRAGKPCRECQFAIEKLKIAGRSSHFCPRCQPKGRK